MSQKFLCVSTFARNGVVERAEYVTTTDAGEQVMTTVDFPDPAPEVGQEYDALTGITA